MDWHTHVLNNERSRTEYDHVKCDIIAGILKGGNNPINEYAYSGNARIDITAADIVNFARTMMIEFTPIIIGGNKDGQLRKGNGKKHSKPVRQSRKAEDDGSKL